MTRPSGAAPNRGPRHRRERRRRRYPFVDKEAGTNVGGRTDGVGAGGATSPTAIPWERRRRAYRLAAAPLGTVGMDVYPFSSTGVPSCGTSACGGASAGRSASARRRLWAHLDTNWTRFGGELRERFLSLTAHMKEVGVAVGSTPTTSRCTPRATSARWCPRRARWRCASVPTPRSSSGAGCRCCSAPRTWRRCPGERYTKLSSHPPCGAQMPLAQPPLGSADLACVLAWIAAQ